MQLTESIDADLRILNAAEMLFAEVGFEAASMRNITEKAEVNLASVNYYFGSKNKLIMAVLRRIIEPINKERQSLLRNARDTNSLTVKTIVEAFLKPLRIKSGADAEPNIVFFSIVGRCITAPKDLQEAMYNEFFHELAEEFVQCLIQALPDVSESQVRLRFHFMVCLMLGVLVRMPYILANPLMDLGDNGVNKIMNDLCDYAESGFIQEEARV